MKCRIPDCCNSTSQWGAYCNAHKSRKRRHGHPLQETISTADVAPFVKVIRARRLRNPDAEAWRILTARWAVMQDYCQGTVDVYMSGVPAQGHHVQAARELLTLAQHVDPNEAVDTVMAIYLLQDARPRAFKSDVAFVHQIARRVRGLTEVNSGTWFDHSTGRVRRVYRELPPRTAVEMGALLVQALGAGGLHMVKLEQRDRDRKAADNHELHRAMEALS